MDDSRADEFWEAARAAWDAGDFARAVEPMENLLRTRASTPALWTMYADILAILQRWPQAEHAAKQALDLDPDFVMAHACLGYMKLAQQRLEEAETHFRKAHSLQPDRPTTIYLVGAVLVKRGDFVESESWLRRAVELNPKYDEAYFHLGLALDGMGRRDEANSMYQKAIMLNPELQSANEALNANRRK